MRYGRGVDASERARLVEGHLDVARRAAAMIYPRVKQYVELDELVALANTGLAEAAQRYEPGHGAAFTTFAWYRVHGAIMDGLRRATQLPRREWVKLVALRAAAEYLEHRGEREQGGVQRNAAPPSRAEALAAVKDALAAIKTIYMTSLETMQEGGFDVGQEPVASAEQIDAGRDARRVRKAFARLTEKERALMQKHYWEGKNLLEAATEMGMSKSWASRLHAQAIEKLRAGLDPPDS